MAQLVAPLSQFISLVFLIHVASLMSLPVLSEAQSVTLMLYQSVTILTIGCKK